MTDFIKFLTFVPRFSNLFIILSIVVVFVPSVPLVNSAKILAVFPHIGKSHQDVFQPLVDGLAEKGHDVVVVSFFPKKEPVENYTDIVLDSGKMSLMYNSLPIHVFKGIQGLGDFFKITDIGMQCCEMVLSSEPVKNLLNSEQKFDLIITELFQIDCFLGFVHRFKAPFIALSSSVLLPSSSDRFGNPDNPAFIPNVFLTHSDRMDYFQRFYNTFATVAIKFIRTYYYDVAAEKIARKYFGPSLPPLHEIAKNTSLVLVNSHPTLNRPRPLAPAVIDVGGMHIKPEKKLPQDLQEYLDNSPQGVILFSMGSTLLTHTFPEEKRNMIMEAFAEMPQNVLCKWENDTLPNKPNNVKILKWLPQRDILAHPNLIAFVSHGGLLGTTEAVFCGVPVVAMPMYGDQGTNSRAIEASGAGIFLSYSKLTKEIFHKALTKIVSKTYRDKAQRLSELYRDRPLPPLQTALFWTEHVLRFGGGEHIRLATVSMPWYQCVLLDVILGAAVILILVMYVVFMAAQKLTALIISKDVIGKCINNEKKIK